MFKVIGMIFFVVNGELQNEQSTLDYETLENCAAMHTADEPLFDAMLENYVGFSCIRVELDTGA